jgi:hypothetical protein
MDQMDMSCGSGMSVLTMNPGWWNTKGHAGTYNSPVAAQSLKLRGMN